MLTNEVSHSFSAQSWGSYSVCFVVKLSPTMGLIPRAEWVYDSPSRVHVTVQSPITAPKVKNLTLKQANSSQCEVGPSKKMIHQNFKGAMMPFRSKKKQCSLANLSPLALHAKTAQLHQELKQHRADYDMQARLVDRLRALHDEAWNRWLKSERLAMSRRFQLSALEQDASRFGKIAVWRR